MIIVIAHNRLLVGRYSAPLLSGLQPTKSCGFSPCRLGALLLTPLGALPTSFAPWAGPRGRVHDVLALLLEAPPEGVPPQVQGDRRRLRG